MCLSMIAEKANQLKINVTHCVQQSRSLIPVVSRKPVILRHWLLNARSAQIFLLAVLILMPTVVPMVVGPVLDFVFPPETRERLFGLVSTSKENPLRNGAAIVTYVLISLSALAVFVYLLLRQLPPSVKFAEQASLDREQEADRLLAHKPSASVYLYDEALAWAPGERREASVRSKIDQLNARTGSGGDAAAKAPTSAEGTAIFDASSINPFPGPVDGRYEISEQLGQGAMGIVYKALDTKLDRQVALKQLAPSLVQDQDLLARFRQEARALARLSHGNIVQVYDFVETEGQAWIVMELVEGEDLDQVLAGKKITIAAVRKLGRQMAQGLAYAHDKGVIHRDFKPANVILTRDKQVKITDFGIARIAGSSVKTQVNTIMGSPAYMSPEQANGDPVDPRTDIYALGISLYWMATGQLPFTGEAAAVLAQHLSKKPPALRSLRDDIPESFEKLVMRMLAKKPQQRPRDMREVASSL